MKLATISALVLLIAVNVDTVAAKEAWGRRRFHNHRRRRTFYNKPCDTGKYSSDGRQDEGCSNCGKGQYQDETLQTGCKFCDPGQYTNTEGQAGCVECVEGKYTGASGTVDCVNCAMGQYVGTKGNSECIGCPEGQYQNVAGKTSCINCANGKVIAAWSSATSNDDPGDCTNCDLGTYFQCVNGVCTGDTCSHCPGGKYTGTGAHTECTSCPSGKWLPANDANDANSNDEAMDCKDCPAGEYHSTTGAECHDCPPGKYSASAGTTTACTKCGAGQYQDDAHTLSCKSCDDGKYIEPWSSDSSNDNASDCKDCLAGRFHTSTAGECLKCPVGKHNENQAQQTVCSLCTGGRYQDEDGKSTCKQCQNGKYLNSWQTETSNDNADDCMNCQAGRFHPSSGSSCVKCPAGKFQPTEGVNTGCVSCGAGKYQDQDEQLSCKDCANGKYLAQWSSDTSNDNIDDCTKCEGGKYNAGTGASCANCPLGKFQPDTGMLECEGCGAGRYQDVPGLMQCKDCHQGRAAAAWSSDTSNDDADDCLKCPAGQYNPDLAAAQCKDCPAGKYQAEQEKDVCEPCQAKPDINAVWNHAEGQIDANCPWTCADGHKPTHEGTKCDSAGASITVKSTGSVARLQMHSNGALQLSTVSGNAVCLEAPTCAASGTGHSYTSTTASHAIADSPTIEAGEHMQSVPTFVGQELYSEVSNQIHQKTFLGFPAGFEQAYPTYLQGGYDTTDTPCNGLGGTAHGAGGANVKLTAPTSVGMACSTHQGADSIPIALPMDAVHTSEGTSMDAIAYDNGQAFPLSNHNPVNALRFFQGTVPAGDWKICCSNGWATGAFIPGAAANTRRLSEASLQARRLEEMGERFQALEARIAALEAK